MLLGIALQQDTEITRPGEEKFGPQMRGHEGVGHNDQCWCNGRLSQKIKRKGGRKAVQQYWKRKKIIDSSSNPNLLGFVIISQQISAN